MCLVLMMIGQLKLLISIIFVLPVLSWKILPRQNPIVDSTINIIKQCHGNDIPILLMGDFRDSNLSLFHNIKKISLFYVNDHVNMRYNPIVHSKLDYYVILVDSLSQFNFSIKELKNSHWWNHLGNIIIIKKFSQRDNCKDSADILLNAWRIDLLNSIVLCSKYDKKITIYTYNPFTKWAPDTWKFVEKHEEKKNIFWYLYSQAFQPDAPCENFFFDKTLRLNGYKGIKGAFQILDAQHPDQEISLNSSCSVKRNFDVAMSHIAFRQLNVNIQLTHSHEYGTITQDGDALGLDASVARGTYDLLLDFRYLAYSKDLLHSTSALGQSGITFVTYQRGNVSIYIELLHLYSPSVIFLSFITLMLTVLVLRLFVYKNIGGAVIDVFRLLFNGPLLKVPNIIYLRIFFFTILIFVLIIQTILRSKIFSFVHTPKPDDLNTFDDLIRSNYKVYCMKGFDFFLSSRIRNHCTLVDTHSKFLHTNRRIALVWDYYNNMDLTIKYKMHHSKEMKPTLWMAYRIRKNWPLINRVRTIYNRIFESGVVTRLLDWSKLNVTNQCIKKEIQLNENHKPFTLDDLLFAFEILAAGLSISFISFLVESFY